MGSDVKQQLEKIREKNASSDAEARQHFVVVAQGLRHDLHNVADGLHEVQIVFKGMRHELQLVAKAVAKTHEILDRIDAKFDKFAFDIDTRVTRLEAAVFGEQR